MSIKSMDDVRAVIDSEGFDYGLRHYLSFKGVDDAKFQQLLKAYREAADALEKHIGSSDDVDK